MRAIDTIPVVMTKTEVKVKMAVVNIPTAIKGKTIAMTIAAVLQQALFFSYSGILARSMVSMRWLKKVPVVDPEEVAYVIAVVEISPVAAVIEIDFLTKIKKKRDYLKNLNKAVQV